MDYGEYHHIHVSERESGIWTDCMWTSAVEFARAVGQDVPATLAEAHTLRAASGDMEGGSSQADVVRGMLKRYGWQGSVRANTNLNPKTYLVPGTVAVVQGSMGKFPTGSHFRRYDPSFTGGHGVCVFRLDTNDRVWWCDPLAPTVGYSGEWMSFADLRLFMSGSPGGAMQYADINSRRSEVFPVVTSKPLPGGPRSWRVIGSAAKPVVINGYDPAQPGKVVKAMTWTAESSALYDAEVSVAWVGVAGTSAPIPKGGPFLHVTNGAYAGLLIVKALVTVPADPPTYTKADIDAAIAANEAKWDAWVASHP